MINGIINVYKEKGYTSHDVIAKLRGIVKQKKIGHTGTLDPDATGVLPVCFGKATGVCDLLTDRDKNYRAVMLLGIVTDTQDVSGQILQQQELKITESEVETAIYSFIGEYQQIPPMYSALKVNGQKLCDLARNGISVERKPRPVKIYDIKIESIQLPRVTMMISCSKGTYIRTLLHDIGQVLQCGGCMEELERTMAAGFECKDALTLDQIKDLVVAGKLEEHMVKVDDLFPSYQKGIVSAEFNKLLYNGNRLKREYFLELKEPVDKLRVYDTEGMFIGLYEADLIRQDVKPLKIFMDREKNGVY
ncbi:MAG: tRNA pseudouridine(55) synthase TruB [Lachnospiraceae bacterium]